MSRLQGSSEGAYCPQAYDEQRRRKDAEREARELAEEQEAERLAAEKQAREDEEAAKWMGQISMEQQGEDAQSEEQAQVDFWWMLSLFFVSQALDDCSTGARIGLMEFGFA